MSDNQIPDLEDELRTHWLIVLVTSLTVVAYIVVCHFFGTQFQMKLDESQRVLLRSALYAIAIIIFPLASLLRHIFLRLNQTMPGGNPPSNRYLTTVLVTQGMIELVAIFGLLMFIFGDDFNTLYIFSSMAVLGIYLHRPKRDEYRVIVEAFMSRRR